MRAGEDRTVLVLAPAKVNPHLEVTGRGEDGYHRVRTLMVALELADRLTLRTVPGAPAGSAELELEGPFATPDVPTDEGNLALRATRLALERAGGMEGGSGPPPGVGLRLEKQVPSQAGLGGASSDAAAALRAVEGLLAVDLGAEWRREVLGNLGSDCPFFDVARNTGAALCTGRGERVEPLDSPKREWWLALVTPATPSPTAAVYQALEFPLSHPEGASNVRGLLGMRAGEARAGLFNQLESAALVAVPELRGWREALDAAGAAHFLLSGSGSTFFGLFDSADAARAALGRVTEEVGRRGLAIRGRWVTRTRGHGSKLVRSGA